MAFVEVLLVAELCGNLYHVTRPPLTNNRNQLLYEIKTGEISAFPVFQWSNFVFVTSF